jgi:hypothetical protein
MGWMHSRTQPELMPHRKKDFKDIDERIDIVTASGDEWAQELRWMNKMQTTSARTVLFR